MQFLLFVHCPDLIKKQFGNVLVGGRVGLIGAAVEDMVGDLVGNVVGAAVRGMVGDLVGNAVGDLVGIVVGDLVG
eukprot:CAMPEP_0172519856 /NCGR_PEP_ID=MMETSP1066-20121228/291665_1 /TAXON_ID=671091 /ORGANISM="Coscinodiscus wailesii, Strain CCMP2513" /LENGTH=74 /DNA_ID=CAMNT_0013302519 /DNA_START=1377 /DNA_END=1598 /DNA_ORIENTATION=-